jgi:hypothetical protein
MNLSIAAVATSHAALLERMSKIPSDFWWKLAMGVAGLVVVVLVLRHVAKMNRLMLAFGLFLFATTIGFKWIHDRTEPSWATPVVQVIAGFFPGKVRA